ncbi:integrase core domain protein, partial [Ancylostoma duodenale]
KDKWPHKPSPDVVRYFALRQSLAIQNDCLFFGPRIVIPSKLCRRVLQLSHDGHPGTTRMKMLARSYVYWTNITKDIEEYVRACRNCQDVAKAPLKTELFSWPTEKQPWSRVHIDYAGPLNGNMFLVIVDAYSKWPEIIEMTSTTSAATIRQLTRLFAQFGNPTTLVSDNGSQFASKEFAEFCITNGITHVRSLPFHPQLNGQAKRFVDTFKIALEKLKDSGTTSEALQKFLQTYCRTFTSRKLPWTSATHTAHNADDAKECREGTKSQNGASVQPP